MLSVAARKAQQQRRTAERGLRDFEPASVGLRHVAHHREPETVSRDLLVSPFATTQHAIPIARRDAWAVVLDADAQLLGNRRVGLESRADAHRAAAPLAGVLH